MPKERFLRRLALRLGTLGLVGMLALGLWREGRADPLHGRAEHRAGFSVAVPQGYIVRRKADALHLVSANTDAPRMIAVHASRDIQRLSGPDLCSGELRDTAHGRVCYSVITTDDAAGERRHLMTTGLRFGSAFVAFTAEHQTGGDPDFENVWKIVDSLR